MKKDLSKYLISTVLILLFSISYLALIIVKVAWSTGKA